MNEFVIDITKNDLYNRYYLIDRESEEEFYYDDDSSCYVDALDYSDTPQGMLEIDYRDRVKELN